MASSRGFVRDGRPVLQSPPLAASSSGVASLCLNRNGAGGSNLSDGFPCSMQFVQQPTTTELQQSYLSVNVAFQSVLHLLCSVYEGDPSRRERLFSELCNQFSYLSPLLAQTSVELSSLRSHYEHAFVRLFKKVQIAVSGDNILTSLQQGSRGADGLFHCSRYENEYEELEYIARGGFGTVFKVRNKLDGQEYAMKKLVLKYRDPEVIRKIIREVTTLAKLNHPNVLCYKTAWLEPLVTPAAKDKQSWNPAGVSATGAAGDEDDDSSWNPTADHDGEASSFAGESHSSGIIFSDDRSQILSFSASSSHISSSNLPGKQKRFLTGNVASIKELDDSDNDDTDAVPRVVGMAATPPNRAVNFKFKDSKFLSGVSSRRVMTSKQGGDSGESGSKYWAKELVDRQCTQVQGILVKPRCLRERDPPAVGRAPSLHDKAILFLQTQLCHETLRHWLDRRNSMTPVVISVPDNELIFTQILHGVQYIHSQGIIHRDLKPRNIFIDQELKVQIGDFGLAKEELQPGASLTPSPEEGSAPDYTAAVEETKTALQRMESRHTSGVGTQAYAAPEQLTDGIIDDKSDVYSLGILLLEFYCSFVTGMERSKCITNLRQGQIPEDLERNFPVVAAAVRRMTSLDPSERPSTADLLRDEFANENKKGLLLSAMENREVARLKKLNRELREQLEEKNVIIARQEAEIALLRSTLLAQSKA